VPTRQTPLI